MYESVSTVMKLSSALEDGLFDSKIIDTNEKVCRTIDNVYYNRIGLQPKQAIYILAEQFKLLMNELETTRNRFELKEEELVDVKKLLKLKQDEISEYCIRIALNDKKLDTLSKQFDDDTSKYLQILETTRTNAQKEIK